jgi:hypothetical protein
MTFLLKIADKNKLFSTYFIFRVGSPFRKLMENGTGLTLNMEI